jgi:hypothetical protein
MRHNSRREELAERLRERLEALERFLSSPSTEISDAKFEEAQQEAIKLRDMLKMLKSLD